MLRYRRLLVKQRRDPPPPAAPSANSTVQSFAEAEVAAAVGGSRARKKRKVVAAGKVRGGDGNGSPTVQEEASILKDVDFQLPRASSLGLRVRERVNDNEVNDDVAHGSGGNNMRASSAEVNAEVLKLEFQGAHNEDDRSVVDGCPESDD